MGRDGALYEIAQWYPRLCVYDDVRGWNTEPYLGQGEFYLEYGDFNVEITVPAGYIIGATGMLTNPHDVLTAAEIARLAQAGKSDTPIHIITQDELASGAARPKKTGTLTWKFHASNVRDAVFATSPQYLWDASNYNGRLAPVATTGPARSKRGRTRPTCPGCRSWYTRWAGSPIPIRRSRWSRGR